MDARLVRRGKGLISRGKAQARHNDRAPSMADIRIYRLQGSMDVEIRYGVTRTLNRT